MSLISQNPVLMFGITVDKHFLPKPAQDLIKSHEFNKVPLINGINNDECGWLVPAVSKHVHSLGIRDFKHR